MGFKEEYLLSEYQELGLLNDHKNVRLARNKINGKIVVKKELSPLNKDVYMYLKDNYSRFTPQIFEILEINEQLVVIEEYISGNTLEELVNQKLFSEAAAIDILKQMCDALLPLHTLYPPIILRDIKADNIVLTDTHEIKLIDFDIARIYKKGLKKDTCLLGSEGYAAPEQYGYRQTDQRTDIYALGVLFNYLLTGCFLTEKVVDGTLGHIIKHCTEMEPNQRFQSVIELKKALEDVEGIVSTNQTNDYIEKKALYRKIPGFRSGKIWKMICAILGYWFITDFCFGLELEMSGVPLSGMKLWMEKTFVWISHLAYIGIAFDCFQKNDKIPFLKSKNKFIKAIGLILMYFILISIGVIICVMLESLFF